MRRLLLALALLLPVGCGTSPPSSSNDLAAAVDGGTGGDDGGGVAADLAAADLSGLDLTGLDLAGLDLARSDPGPDGGMGGPQKLASGRFDIIGRTSDDQLILYNKVSTQLQALPSTGGVPLKLVTNPILGFTQVRSKVVVAWYDTIDGDNGPLLLWTAAAGLKRPAMTSLGGTAAISADGQWVAFYDKLNQDATLADLVIIKPDGTGAKTLLTQTPVRTNSCTTQLQFAGGRLIVVRCVLGGNPAAAIVSFDPATAKSVDLLAKADDFVTIDDAGTAALVRNELGVGMVVPSAGGNPLVASIPGLRNGRFTSDGSALVAVANKQLVRIPIKGGMPTVLQPMVGGGALLALAPDGKTALYYTMAGLGSLTDVVLASALQPGAPTVLHPKTTGFAGDYFGDAFTSDSAFALFASDVDPGTYAGTLNVAPTAGGMAKAIAQKYGYTQALGGSRVLFNDRFTPVVDEDGRADVRIVDLAKGTPPTLLATQANYSFEVSADGKALIYGDETDPGKVGLYRVSIP